MTKSKIVSRSALVVALATIWTAGAAFAGALTPGLESQLTRLKGDDMVKVLVVLRQQADISTLDRELHAAKAPLQVRHQTVVTALQDVARGGQSALLAELAAGKSGGLVEGFTPHWILNAVVVRATASTVRQLALREDVAVIEADLEIELIEPVSVKTDAPRPSADKSGFVPPGVIAIGAQRVWHELGITGAGTIVANMDSGVDCEHPALAERWQGNFAPRYTAWRDIALVGSRYLPVDYNGHGTHTMGTITGATAFDTLGVAPGARWIANNAVASAFEGYDNKIIAGFEFTADPDGNPATHDDVPDVMHNSWGVRVGYGYVACDSRWWDAIDHCEAAGVVITFSAGNEGPAPMSLRSPGDRATSPTSCFTVGSTAKEDPFVISSFSSRGPSACGGPNAIKPEVMAPGDDIYSTFPGGGYAYMSGTSMAGPHVAGVVALMRQAAPDLDVTAIKEILMDTAIDLGEPGEDNNYGWGFIDAYAAVSRVMNNTGVIAGNVVDASTGLPLVGAVVHDLRGQTQRVTPASGDFSFRVLSGAATVRVSKFGYETQDLPVAVPVLGSLDLQVELRPMPPATVEGTVRDQAGQPVEGATVTALDTPLPAAVTDWRGYYRLVLPSGAGVIYDLLALAPDLAYVVQSVGLEDGRAVDLVLPALRADGFESGDFAALPWQRTGQVAWTVTDQQAADGAHSARSGAVAHGGATTLTLAHYVNGTGTMSFRYRTDSEITYDALKFYVDGAMLGNWSGSLPWAEFTLELTPGQHTLKWEYRKDSSVSIGEDAVWIDQVLLPGTGQAPQAMLNFAVAPVALSLAPAATGTRPLLIGNTGSAALTYTAAFLGLPPAWCSVQPGAGTVQPFNTAEVTLAFDATQATVGANNALLQLVTNDPAHASTFVLVTLTVLAAADVPGVPAELTVRGAVPNPFNPSTEIVFALPAAGPVRVDLYDVSGRLVRTLADGDLPAGENRLRWDGNDDRGRALASGVYYLRVETAAAVKGAALSGALTRVPMRSDAAGSRLRKGSMMNRHHWGMLLAALALVTAAASSAAAMATATDKLGARLSGVMAAQDAVATTGSADEPTFAVWVTFTDKGVTGPGRDAALREAGAALSGQARLRREHRSGAGLLVDEADLPLAAAYLDGVAATGMRPRRQSRWLNAASFEATATQIEAAANLPYVAAIDLVRQSGRSTVSELQPVADLERSPDKGGDAFAYGPGRPQLDMINVPPAHALGLTGAGVTIAIFDTGFDLRHEAFDATDVAATWNFIDETPEVGPIEGEDRFQLLHGTAVLSLLAAQTPGVMVGAAPGATYLLAKTEDVSSETSAEEDNWIAALEWAEGLGADVVSSGVGYYYWYDFSDLDGVTTMITTAAELAAARGVCVVNSAGNERNNPDWPHLIAPADGRHVIAVGAVSAEGLLASFSSPGPTADGRRKPDVMGRGIDLLAALGGTGYLYGLGTGVDYGVSLVAGAVALMLERSPGLTPGQVLTALHATGSRAAAPDNDYGWGIADAMAAIDYGLPEITHVPLADREAASGGGYEVTATITAATGLLPGGSYAAWRRDAQAWQLLPLTSLGGDAFRAVIPAQTGSGVIQYYLVAEETGGRSALLPLQGADAPFDFRFGADLQAPVLAHAGLADVVPANWPPLLVVDATDNVGVAAVMVTVKVNGVAAGTSALAPAGDHWELPFPVAAGAAPVGTELSYRITATDQAAAPNSVTTADYSLRVVASRGNVLLVDERNGSKSTENPGRRDPPAKDADKSITDIAGWLTAAGFQVTTKTGGATQAADFIGRDLVVVSCGLNSSPLANSELRDALVDHTLAGGRILMEGGEVGYVCVEQPHYPEIAQEVLNADGYLGEESATLWPSGDHAAHPFLHRPHSLETALPIADTGNWYGAADIMRPEPDALALMHPPAGGAVGGVIVHDDNSCPEAGQTVYFAFDLGKMAGADARMLVENAATWLTYREPAGPSSIIGRVFLPGSMDFSSLTVTARSGQTAVVKPNGTYKISGLWGGHHVVTASAPGYGSQTLETILTDGQQTALNFTLPPVVTVSGSAAPNLAIPDNNLSGLSSVINIGSGSSVQGVEVDVDIAHFSIGQLVVELVSPNGTTVTLHNRTGGVSDNIVGTWPTTLVVDGPGDLAGFDGVNPVGAWTLKVSDRVFGATGSLRSWGLRLLVTGSPASDVGNGLPPATRLAGNAPNPFNPRTAIAFSLGAPGPVRLEVFDARGRLVRRLADDTYESGRHEIVWDGTDDAGQPAASGVYFARLQADGNTDVGKMMLLK